MPYTKEELENNEYYINLRDEDEQLYLGQRELYKTAFFGNGGVDDGSLLVRDCILDSIRKRNKFYSNYLIELQEN